MAGPVNHVDVSVDDKGNVTCSPDPVRVRGAKALLVFKMASPGWTFADTDAIVVENPGSEFPYASWTTKPTMAVLVDQNSMKASYKYSVAVIQTSTGKRFVQDPGIENEA
jgi:hypothetical protein